MYPMAIPKRIIIFLIAFLFCLPIFGAQKVEIEPIRIGITVSTVTVGIARTALPATAQRGRKAVLVTNTSSNTIHIGGSSVTTADGTPLKKDQAIAFDVSDNIILYGIAGIAGNDIRVLELR